MRVRGLVMAAAWVVVVACAAWGQRGGVRVSAEVSSAAVTVGERVVLRVRVDGADAARVEDFEAEGFEVERVGGTDVSSTSVTIVNGRRTERRFEGYVLEYVLTPVRVGLLEVPALDVEVGGETFRTEAIRVRVREPAEDAGMRLLLDVAEREVYEGEPVSVEVTWLSENPPRSADFTLLGDRGAFEIFAAEPRSGGRRQELDFLGTRVAAQETRSRTGSGESTRYTWRVEVVPRASGELVFGPVVVVSDVVVRAARSVFDRERTARVRSRSEAVRLDVRALPAEGRPEGFGGLVGRYEAEASVRPGVANVGDPMTLTVRVSGPMVERVEASDLGVGRALGGSFRVSEEVEVRSGDGSKVFEFTIRPTASGVDAVPSVGVAHFDTGRGAYRVAETGSIPIEVRETRVVTAEDVGGGSAVGEALEDAAGSGAGIAHNYEGRGALVDQRFSVGGALREPVVMGLLAGPPAVFALVGVGRVVSARGRGGARGRARRALAEARGLLGEGEVGGALRAYVGGRSGRPGGGLTPGECRALVESGTGDPGLAAEVEGVLERWEASRFGGAGGGVEAGEGERLVRAMEGAWRGRS